ncbi:MAG: hypothetical protein U1F43_19715 [Myxococcota bacterium]
MHRQALDHLRAGDMAAASVDIERLAAAVEPTARALLELAKLAAAVGDGAAAAARIDAALALAPDVAEAHFVRGVLHELAARPADAGASYAEALACDPTHWRAATNRAALLAEDGDPVAIDEASRLLDVAERYGRGPIPPLLVTRARIHERRGEADLAAVLRETAALLADWP